MYKLMTVMYNSCGQLTARLPAGGQLTSGLLEKVNFLLDK